MEGIMKPKKPTRKMLEAKIRELYMENQQYKMLMQTLSNCETLDDLKAIWEKMVEAKLKVEKRHQKQPVDEATEPSPESEQK